MWMRYASIPQQWQPCSLQVQQTTGASTTRSNVEKLGGRASMLVICHSCTAQQNLLGSMRVQAAHLPAFQVAPPLSTKVYGGCGSLSYSQDTRGPWGIITPGFLTHSFTGFRNWGAILVALSRLPSLFFLQPQHLCRLYGLLVFSLKKSVGSLLVYLVFWFLLVEEVFSGYVWLTILPSFLKIISFLKKTVYFYGIFSLFIIVFI